jgi:tRNA(adenine34) deaminase
MENEKKIIHETFMREALKEAKRAFQKGDVPVGAVAVFQNRIIARGYNQVELLHDPTAHAEMITITEAADFLRTKAGPEHRGSLEGVSLYVTLEPCPMCAGALVLAHAKELIYSARDPKFGACGSLHNLVQDNRFNHQVSIASGILEPQARELLQDFFKTLRKDRR